MGKPTCSGISTEIEVEMAKLKQPPMGAYWNETGCSKLYQLYRRVEDVATALEKRRQSGFVPAKPYVEELFDIATQLKILDKKVKS